MISPKQKKILITGGTSGLGYELVKYFVRSGYTVFTTGRDPSKLAGADYGINFIRTDFTDLNDIRNKTASLLDDVGNIDLIINNAGVLGPHNYTETVDGFEYTMQVNFLSHLLINNMIAEKKRTPEPMTMVSVSSPVYRYYKPSFKLPGEKNFHSFRTYSESKIYLLFLGGFLDKNYPEKNLKYFSFNPGIFRSGISRTKKKWFRSLYQTGAPFMRNPEKVAGKLFEILSRNIGKEGMIYRSTNSYTELDELLVKMGENFLRECSIKLEEHFKRGEN